MSRVESLTTGQIATDIAAAVAAAALDATAKVAAARAVPRWAPMTAYTNGQQVVSPGNDVVSAVVAFTSGAIYVASNWVQSSTYVPALVVVGAGIDPTGVADSTAAIQAKIDAAETAGGGVVYFPTGTYSVTGLLLPSGVTLQGPNSGSQMGGAAKLVYAGVAGGSVIAPKNRAINTINIGIKGIEIAGASLAAIGIDMYRTSYSRIQDCGIGGIQAAGVGVLFDANVDSQCYFNVADGVKCDGSGGSVGVRFQNGANANRWEGGKIGNGTTGMEFLSLSTANLISGVDMENASVKHLYIDASENKFVGIHMEVAPIGYDITAMGMSTRRFGSSIATSVTVPVASLTDNEISLDKETTDTAKLQLQTLVVKSRRLTTATTIDIDPVPYSGTAQSIVNWWRNTNTSGAKQFNIYKGDGTGSSVFQVDAATGNVSLLAFSPKLFFYSRSVSFAVAAPGSGTWGLGSRVFNQTPAVGQPKGWVCTVAGTPGTWVSEGNL